jgi:16S rRNA (uracil1498-N3)-methyltransferase
VRLTRVHVPLPLSAGTVVSLPEAAAAHLVRVLRLGIGDACVLFNGDGHDYDARLVVADKRGAEARVETARRVDNESPLRAVLVQGIARGDRMDWVLQKATELGAAAFVPVASERSEVRLSGDRALRRHAHWSSVVVAACEQSGRALVPDVAQPAALADAMAALPGEGCRLFLDPDASADLATVAVERAAGCVLAVGPEGGWSPRDRELLCGAGFIAVRLGPRVLRTETAGLAALAALQLRHGDLA